MATKLLFFVFGAALAIGWMSAALWGYVTPKGDATGLWTVPISLTIGGIAFLVIQAIKEKE
jgi:hypothetical protein